QSGWRAFKVQGPLDFSLTGVIASLVQPLAEAKISVFTIATYDTDYILVQEPDLAAAQRQLAAFLRL
ncbi:MAG TPA: ACT domain-containing protein, partial [Gammaproteobacteria bacterium]|nr:ACT domain-containing protein [Gammaproteobacteria bacterium]